MPLGGVLVPLEAADEHLVNLDWPGEQRRRGRPRLPDAVRQMPRRLLRAPTG